MLIMNVSGATMQAANRATSATAASAVQSRPKTYTTEYMIATASTQSVPSITNAIAAEMVMLAKCSPSLRSLRPECESSIAMAVSSSEKPYAMESTNLAASTASATTISAAVA